MFPNASVAMRDQAMAGAQTFESMHLPRGFFEDVSIWKWEKWSPSCIFFWGSWPKETRNQWSACAHLRTKCRARAGGIKGPQWPKNLRTSRNKGPNKPNHQHAKLTFLPETQKKSVRNATPPFTNNHVSLPKPGPSHSCHRHHGHGLTHKWRACVSHVSCCFKSHGFDVAMWVKNSNANFKRLRSVWLFQTFPKKFNFFSSFKHGLRVQS